MITGFERIFWLCHKKMHLNQLDVQLIKVQSSMLASCFTEQMQEKNRETVNNFIAEISYKTDRCKVI
ncbi:hypothetical protein AUQ27_20000 [Escherichia coli]|nr:hypothetical protein AUQ27_20000 [Escherichia coli]